MTLLGPILRIASSILFAVLIGFMFANKAGAAVVASAILIGGSILAGLMFLGLFELAVHFNDGDYAATLRGVGLQELLVVIGAFLSFSLGIYLFLTAKSLPGWEIVMTAWQSLTQNQNCR